MKTGRGLSSDRGEQRNLLSDHRPYQMRTRRNLHVSARLEIIGIIQSQQESGGSTSQDHHGICEKASSAFRSRRSKKATEPAERASKH